MRLLERQVTQLHGSQASSLDKLYKLMIIDYTAMVTVVLKECELIIFFFYCFYRVWTCCI